MSRLRILFLFARLLALATAFAACGGSGGSSNANPQQVVDDATLQGIESGNLDLSLGIDAKGTKAATSTSASPARSRARARASSPQLDMTARRTARSTAKTSTSRAA